MKHNPDIIKKALFAGIILLFISLPGCFAQSCEDLPDQFANYSSAINSIKKADFGFTDELPAGKSSWIISANYYSCDGQTGYLIFITDKDKEYIHEKVPLQVWNDFKHAVSSGTYYDFHIRRKYRMVPNR